MKCVEVFRIAENFALKDCLKKNCLHCEGKPLAVGTGNLGLGWRSERAHAKLVYAARACFICKKYRFPVKNVKFSFINNTGKTVFL